MIKTLQKKFILITMGSLFLVMVLLVGSINFINLYQIETKLNGAIEILSDNGGQFPHFEKKDQVKDDARIGFQMNAETQFETRYFIVEVLKNGDIQKIDTSHIAAVTSEDAQNYATKIMEANKTSGYSGIYKYAIVETQDGYMLIFMDSRSQIQTAKLFLLISCGVAFVTLFLMFILISVFSKRILRPISESMEKQKQFITDAGHEIKTPIAIISANADVLELTGGESEWITSIRNQTIRLDKLVKNLLLLSKTDESDLKRVFTELNLSNIVTGTVESFHTVAEAQNKKISLDIKPDLKIQGDENSIQQLISTLVDNAIKYSDEGGSIKITMIQTKKGTKINVFNTTDGVVTENLNKLFDRFYRADSSRARETGGYGIGLSIAKSIVEAHHGKITVKSEDGKSICFTVILPQ